MKVYTSIAEKQKSQLCVALGFFDGIHKGHKKVISETVKLKRFGLIPTVFTFEESPKSIIFKLKEKQITDNESKKEKIENLGIEVLYMIDFKKIMNYTPEQFVEKILKEKLNAKYLVCGFNYHFGIGGIADAKKLKEIAERFEIKTKIIKPILYKCSPVSSTRIREAIKNNDLSSANNMLK